EAGAALAEQAPIETQTPPAESLKRAAVLQVQDGQSPERPSTEEDALAQISPQAREAALLFMAKESPRMPANSVPPVRKEGKAGKVGSGQEPEPGKPMGAAPLAGEQPGRADQDGETPVSSGKDGAGGQADKTKQKIPGGAGKTRPSLHGIENIGKSGMGGGPVVPGFPPTMESGEQRDGQSQGPADQSLSDGEEKPPQEENAVGPEGEEPQNGQAATEDQQQQNALSQALSDRIDKLAEDKKLDAEIKQVTKEANLALDGVLMEGVAWVWAAAIPSFGLAVLLGAIIGDFLWAFKNSIIEGVLKPLLRTEALKKKGEEIAKQIKISAKVKLNILAMNLIVAAAVMLVMLFLFLALWVGCNYPPGITKLTYKLSVVGALGGSGICESIDNLTSNFSFGGGDSGGAGASDSWGSPNGLLSTNQWTSQINQAAAQYAVDACILRVVVQKESTGQADIIGCDCAANGKPQLCPAGARGKYYPGYPFNWDQCSYGIGLTQWTIYPKSSSQNWNRWENQGTPSRNLFNDKYYYVSDFLNPQTSLDLTARAFKNYLSQSGGSVAGAFRAYMGSGAPQSWVDQRMALYNMCKSSGGQ
ncbi:MAG: hypothetical protein M1333_01870, partial [Patescibacteria group bacterium]|nr:hypothetical protein [Patescibacteria group bacterium]